jgi:hypothetical protein
MNQKSLWFFLLTFSMASIVYADSSGIEEQRKELCKLLSRESQCAEPKKVFGQPPPNSVSNTNEIFICNDKGTCKASISFPKSGDVPRGSYVMTKQNLTITSKNGKTMAWNGEGSFTPVGNEGFDGNSISYDVEFDQLHQYFWVQEHLLEGGGDEWISYENGKRYSFKGQPRVSPDGNFLLVPEESMEDVKQLFVRIYLLRNNEIVEQEKFDMISEKVEGRFIWVNSNEIAVISHAFNGHTFLDIVTARIRRTEDKWILIKMKDGGA